MGLRYTVLADDLSGAAEIGGTALRHGLSAVICIGDTRPGAEEVSVCDLKTRSLPEEEVPSILQAAFLRSTVEEASGRLYKKVDSVLRGHILVELTELVRRTGRRRALLVPANPSLGRVIDQGTYLIQGVPIDRTDFRNDPQYPILTSSVVEILRPRPSLLPVTVSALGQPLPEEGVIIGEARTSENLREWSGRLDRDTLPAGGAAFFAALLRNDGYEERETICLAPAGPQLLVSGSATESSFQCLRQLQQRGIPVLPMPDRVFQAEDIPLEALNLWTHDTIAAVERSPLVAVTIGRPLAIDRRRAPVLSARLARLAKSVLHSARVAQLWIEGGETASGVVDAMGWRRLTVCGEIEGRVSQLVPEGATSPILNLKPGSYSWPDRCLLWAP